MGVEAGTKGKLEIRKHALDAADLEVKDAQGGAFELDGVCGDGEVGGLGGDH